MVFDVVRTRRDSAAHSGEIQGFGGSDGKKSGDAVLFGQFFERGPACGTANGDGTRHAASEPRTIWRQATVPDAAAAGPEEETRARAERKLRPRVDGVAYAWRRRRLYAKRCDG